MNRKVKLEIEKKDCHFLKDKLGLHGTKNQPLAPPENEGNGERYFSVVFRPLLFILGELCPGLVFVSCPVAKCAYKQHRYRNKCIATGTIYAWAFSVGGVGAPFSMPCSGIVKFLLRTSTVPVCLPRIIQTKIQNQKDTRVIVGNQNGSNNLQSDRK